MAETGTAPPGAANDSGPSRRSRRVLPNSRTKRARPGGRGPTDRRLRKPCGRAPGSPAEVPSGRTGRPAAGVLQSAGVVRRPGSPPGHPRRLRRLHRYVCRCASATREAPAQDDLSWTNRPSRYELHFDATHTRDKSHKGMKWTKDSPEIRLISKAKRRSETAGASVPYRIDPSGVRGSDWGAATEAVYCRRAGGRRTTPACWVLMELSFP